MRFFLGRGDVIRTHGLYVPNVALYQTEPHLDSKIKPRNIKNTGADIVSYGAPVLPGAMFMLAYYQVTEGENPRTVAIMGLPGCVMYAKRTIFDLVLPRVMADDQVTAEELAALGQGGLCLNCPVCTFPNCGFGKGV